MDDRSLAERREFIRYPFDKQVTCKVISSPSGQTPVSKTLNAFAKNLSVSGVLFASTFAPELSSIVVLEMDYRTTRICQEIEESALIVNNRVVGKVVRIEDSGDGTYGVGVAFIKKDSDLPKNVEDLIA
jgi:hypothetical protein